jgi:hypothetical protein
MVINTVMRIPPRRAKPTRLRIHGSPGRRSCTWPRASPRASPRRERYKLHVRVNPNGVIQEVTLDNNEASVDVTIQ